MKKIHYFFLGVLLCCCASSIAQNLLPCYETDAKDKNRKIWGYCDRFYASTSITPKYDTTFAFSEGLGRIRQDGKYGFVDKSGKLVIPPKYDAADDFHEGFAAVFVNNRISYINKQGVDLFKKTFKGGRPFNDKLALVFNDEGLAGYLDTKGIMALPFSFKKAFPFNGGMAPVMGADEKWKAINAKGETLFLFPDKVKYVMGPFSEGLAPVYVDGPSGYKANYDFVNEKGEFICDVPYTSAQPFKNGRAIIARENKDRNGGMQFLKYGLIKKGGREIAATQYACLEESPIPGIYYYGKTSSSISNCKGYGLLDSNGKELTPPNYAGFTRLNNTAFVCKDVSFVYPRYLILNLHGQKVISGSFDNKDVKIAGIDTLLILYSSTLAGDLLSTVYNINTGILKENISNGFEIFAKQKMILFRDWKSNNGALLTTSGKVILDKIQTTGIHRTAADREKFPFIMLKKSEEEQLRVYNLTTQSFLPGDIGYKPTEAYDYYDKQYSEGLLAVQKNGKWGYMDATGKIVIPAIYDRVKDFHNGWAVVTKRDKGEDGDWYKVYLNKAGKEMPGIKAEYASDFSEGIAYYQKGYDEPVVYINSTGKVIYKSKGGYFFDFGEFSNGLAAVPNDEKKYGYINAKGELVIPCQYSPPDKKSVIYLSFNKDGLATVEKDGKKITIDKTGKVIK